MGLEKKYRSTGEQSIKVQHVNVHDGGQAILSSTLQTGGGLPTILQAVFFTHFIKGMYTNILYTDYFSKQQTFLSMELSFVAP